MEIVKAVGLKKYYITDTYEVHALDGVSPVSYTHLPLELVKLYQILYGRILGKYTKSTIVTL